MEILAKGRYRARLAENQTEIKAAQSLRTLAFGVNLGGLDADSYDPLCDHMLVEEVPTGTLVACYRLMQFSSGSQIGQSYCAQFYDLSALQAFKGRMLELGRFCIHPDHSDPEILRVAWGAMTRIVDGQGIEMLFGCSSFAGCNAVSYRDAFALLQTRYLAPRRWRPLAKATEVVSLDAGPVVANAMRNIPPLLRTYLAMGGWVSDHAVVDREMNTMHVFTGVQISAIPEARKRLLRAVAS